MYSRFRVMKLLYTRHKACKRSIRDLVRKITLSWDAPPLLSQHSVDIRRVTFSWFIDLLQRMHKLLKYNFQYNQNNHLRGAISGSKYLSTVCLCVCLVIQSSVHLFGTCLSQRFSVGVMLCLMCQSGFPLSKWRRVERFSEDEFVCHGLFRIMPTQDRLTQESENLYSSEVYCVESRRSPDACRSTFDDSIRHWSKTSSVLVHHYDHDHLVSGMNTNCWKSPKTVRR